MSFFQNFRASSVKAALAHLAIAAENLPAHVHAAAHALVKDLKAEGKTVELFIEGHFDEITGAGNATIKVATAPIIGETPPAIAREPGAG